MQLATSTNLYFNRPNGEKGDLIRCIHYCGQGGYRRMDLSFLDYANFKAPFVTDGYAAWIDRAAEAADAYGIVFSQGHAPFYNFCDPDAPEREAKDRLILRAVDCAQTLGIPWLAIHAGTDYAAARMRKSSKEKNRAYFLPLLEYAEKRGVGIAFENLWDLNIAPKRRYTAEVEDLVDLVDSFDCPAAGICFDVEHACISGLDPVRELAVIGSRLRATHVSDFLGVKADHLLPFSGVIAWEPFMRALGQMGYQGDVAFEIHRYTENIPDALLPEAVAHSLRIGQYLLGLADGHRKEDRP